MNKEKLMFLASINVIFILFFTFVFSFRYTIPILFFLNLVIVPTYLALTKFIENEYELIFLSTFLAIGIFPTMVATIGRILSLTTSIIISTLILWVFAIYFIYRKRLS